MVQLRMTPACLPHVTLTGCCNRQSDGVGQVLTPGGMRVTEIYVIPTPYAVFYIIELIGDDADTAIMVTVFCDGTLKISAH
jgi:hypothetical protein